MLISLISFLFKIFSSLILLSSKELSVSKILWLISLDDNSEALIEPIKLKAINNIININIIENIFLLALII